jgi:hypothetical protein
LRQCFFRWNVRCWRHIWWWKCLVLNFQVIIRFIGLFLLMLLMLLFNSLVNSYFSFLLWFLTKWFHCAKIISLRLLSAELNRFRIIGLLLLIIETISTLLHYFTILFIIVFSICYYW